MKKKYIIFLLLICFGLLYLVNISAHLHSAERAMTWWRQWFIQSQNNLLPNERGLDVLVMELDGVPIDSRSFDTYFTSNSSFATYIKDLPEDCWVIVAVKDDAATNLSQEDLVAIQSLGGTGELAGKYTWAYILVGRPNLGPGKGKEWLDEFSLELQLAKGELIEGLPIPIDMRIYSYGFKGGSYAGLNVGSVKYTNLQHWIKTALKRM